jgi:glycerol-3-phosphate cytidylyltransferase-like family protein
MTRYKKEKVVIACGEYDPLTAEDVAFLKKCKSKGDWLIVGIHSDWWMLYARGGIVHKYTERREIISNLRFVDEVFTFSDMDGTVCQLLKLVKICYPHADITFVSNEDMDNMPEKKIKGITFETMK